MYNKALHSGKIKLRSSDCVNDFSSAGLTRLMAATDRRLLGGSANELLAIEISNAMLTSWVNLLLCILSVLPGNIPDSLFL